MLRFLKASLYIDRLKLSAVLALVYFCLFNCSVLLYLFEYYSAGGVVAFLELLKNSIYIYIALFIFFFGFTIQIGVLYAFSLFLFISGSIASYYLYRFKIPPTKEVIASLWSTNLTELYEIVSLNLIVWIFFSISVCVYIVRHFSLVQEESLCYKILPAICLLISLNSLILPPYKVLKSYFPVAYLHNTYLYFSEDSTKADNQKPRDITKKFIFTMNSHIPEDLIGILVIGESARYDRFGINGYARDTTPLLKKVKDLVSFEAFSSSNMTYLSVPFMLSRQSKIDADPDPVFRETGLLSVLTYLGFHTEWIGTQSMFKYFKGTNLGSLYEEVNFAILPGGSALFKMNDLDEVLLPYVSDMTVRSGRRFLVVHTSGSHWNYDSRYPVPFRYFAPTCNVSMKADQSDCDRSNLSNSYDNSIIYTDFFLYSIINLLKNQNAILIYVSDHAESLGEKGRYGHGGDPASEQYRIPFMVWTSDKFNDNFPGVRAAILSHKDQKLTHAHLFHSVLDCLGVKSEAINTQMSICVSSVP